MRKGKCKKVNQGKGIVCWFPNPHNVSEVIKVVVYWNDRRNDVAHIHLEINDKTIACLLLEDARYFDHGYNRTCCLSDEILVAFDNAMCEPCTHFTFTEPTTQYTACRRMWNILSGETGIKINKYKGKPDYTKTTRSD